MKLADHQPRLAQLLALPLDAVTRTHLERFRSPSPAERAQRQQQESLTRSNARRAALARGGSIRATGYYPQPIAAKD